MKQVFNGISDYDAMQRTFNPDDPLYRWSQSVTNTAAIPVMYYRVAEPLKVCENCGNHWLEDVDGRCLNCAAPLPACVERCLYCKQEFIKDFEGHCVNCGAGK